MAVDTAPIAEVQNREMGPVDYLLVEFPHLRVTGEGMRELVRLVDQHVIRVLDLVFLRRDERGAVTVLPPTAFDVDDDDAFDLAVFTGASSGLLDDDDLRAAGELLEPGNTGVVLVYENAWAAPLTSTLRRKGAELVTGGRIPMGDVVAALDASEATPSGSATSGPSA